MGRPIAIWTDERIAELVKLWGEGYSGSQIAAMIGNSTRNAVIGKIFRLGLTGRVKQARGPHERKPKTAASPTQKRFFKKAPAFEADNQTLRCAEIVPMHKSLQDLASRECRYPFGDGPFTFCGHPCDGSYCKAHDLLTKGVARPVLSQAEKLQRRREYRATYRASKRLEAAA